MTPPASNLPHLAHSMVTFGMLTLLEFTTLHEYTGLFFDEQYLFAMLPASLDLNGGASAQASRQRQSTVLQQPFPARHKYQPAVPAAPFLAASAPPPASDLVCPCDNSQALRSGPNITFTYAGASLHRPCFLVKPVQCQSTAAGLTAVVASLPSRGDPGARTRMKLQILRSHILVPSADAFRRKSCGLAESNLSTCAATCKHTVLAQHGLW